MTNPNCQLFLPYSTYVESSAAYLAPSSTQPAQTFSVFVNMQASVGTVSFNADNYFPTFQVSSATSITAYWSANVYTITVPTINPNTWYFGAVSGTVGGNVYLYWGAFGTTPTQYQMTVSGASISYGSHAYAYSAGGGVTLVSSMRYWYASLTQAQINAEAASNLPVVTTNLESHFISPISTNTLTALLHDQQGNGGTLSATGTAPQQQFLIPSKYAGLLSPTATDTVNSTNTSLLPAITTGGSMSMSCFISFGSNTTGFRFGGFSGYAPCVTMSTLGTFTVGCNGASGTCNPPNQQPWTTYFCGLTAAYGGQVYLYWGLAGSTPTQYGVVSTGTTNQVDYLTAKLYQYASIYSIRIWTNSQLTQAQMNAEALSYMPVNTPTYHFASPKSTNLTQLKTDAIGGTQTLVDSSGVWGQDFPLYISSLTSNPIFFGSI